MNKLTLFGSLIVLGVLLGFPSGAAIAQMAHEQQTSEQSSQFQRIEQPLWLKGVVTLGGFGLIGLELWWFLFSKSRSPSDL